MTIGNGLMVTVLSLVFLLSIDQQKNYAEYLETVFICSRILFAVDKLQLINKMIAGNLFLTTSENQDLFAGQMMVRLVWMSLLLGPLVRTTGDLGEMVVNNHS